MTGWQPGDLAAQHVCSFWSFEASKGPFTGAIAKYSLPPMQKVVLRIAHGGPSKGALVFF